MSNIRIAILGTAKIARTVAPRIHTAAGAELGGIASRSQSSAAAFATEFDIPRTYESYQAALDDPEIDAVYIPLPPSLHLEWTAKAAEAGKHVLCEKPLARNVAEVDEMISVCRQYGVVLLDGVMWYHTDRATRLREMAASGQLGELRQMTSGFTFRWDKMPMDNLRLHRELGGGALLDLGWYCVGASILLFGEVPQRVSAYSQWHNDVDIRTNAFLWFSDQKIATIECGFDAVRRRWFELTGANETMLCRDFTRPYNPEHPAFVTMDGDGKTAEHVGDPKPQEEGMIEAFCELIRDNRVHHPWLQLSRDTQLTCDALDKSARQNIPMDL